MRQVIDCDGCPINYEVRGSGPAVLFIQGVGLHGDGWRPQVDVLSRDFSCISFDNRGIGGSGPLGNVPLTVERMVADTAAAIAAAGFSASHVAGHPRRGGVAVVPGCARPPGAGRPCLRCTVTDRSDL